MDRRSFLGGVAALSFAAFAPAGEPRASTQAIDRLIEQLGSRRFREREAASKALAEVGEPALDALRTAAKDDADPEVRRRAAQLVNRLDFRQRLGTWRVVSVELRGAVIGTLPRGDDEVTFTADGIASAPWLLGRGTCQVDALATPQHIDVRLYYRDRTVGATVPLGTYRGIYRVEKGELVLCFDMARKSRRPTEFKAAAGSDAILYRLRRRQHRP
jgi:uncharacterized protein (TIGR03067 family)